MRNHRDALRLSFSRSAESYDRYRLGYPEELPALVLGDLSVSYDMLEVGCGTGIATRLFLPYASRLTAVDPSAKMLEVARQRLSGSHALELCCSDFEDADLGSGRYDLLLSAQAFHWLDLERAFPRVKCAVRPGGRIALFWSYFDFEGSALGAEIRDRILSVAPLFGEWPDASLSNYDQYRGRWLDALREAELFEEPVARTLHRFYNVAGPWFAGWLATLSWYEALEQTARARLMERLSAVALTLDSFTLRLKTLLIVADLRSRSLPPH